MRYFVGIDWASEEHAVCGIDETARVVWRGKVSHTAEGLAGLRRDLERLAPASEMRVAIERPTGLLVDTLVDAGFVVVPLHPNAVKASRPRYSAAQGKTDVGDAFMLADILRTDGHRLRALVPLSDETKALRALVRTRDDLVDQRIALANQLRALLESFWAGAAAIFADNSRHSSAWAANFYRAARGRGCDHPHAVRILARAWLRVLWRAWQDRKPYDERLHRAAHPSPRAQKEAA
jgi:transposase